MKTDIVFFDIETTANLAVVNLLPEPTAPSNYKDKDKIDAYIAEKKSEDISRMALDPDFGTIRSIAIKEGDNDVEVIVIHNVAEEKKAIELFWEIAFRHYNRLCGYNIIGFDLPFLMRRSMELGVLPRSIPNLKKYGSDNVIDLMGILYNWQNYKSLKFVAKRYGLTNIAEGVDGSMVATMSDEDLIKYAISDVNLVYELYNKMLAIYF